jgi:hypothetical protein
LGSVTVTGTSTVKLADTIGDVYEKAGALTLQANSVLDFGNNASNKSSVMEFGSANFSTWGTNTLSVWNYTPGVDHLIFDSVTGTIMMSTPYGVIPTTADILFYSDNGQTLINRFGGFPLANSYQYENPNYYTYAGEVVPVPEPTAILSMALLLVAVGWKERRFICRFFGRAPEMAPSPA